MVEKKCGVKNINDTNKCENCKERDTCPILKEIYRLMDEAWASQVEEWGD